MNRSNVYSYDKSIAIKGLPAVSLCSRLVLFWNLRTEEELDALYVVQ